MVLEDSLLEPPASPFPLVTNDPAAMAGNGECMSVVWRV